MSQANLRSRSMMTALYIHCTVRRWRPWLLWRRFHNICTLNLLGSTDRYARATTTCKRRNFPTSFLFSIGRDKLRSRTRHPSVCVEIQRSTCPWWGRSFGLEAAWRHSSKGLKRTITIWPSGQRRSLFGYSAKLLCNFVWNFNKISIALFLVKPLRSQLAQLAGIDPGSRLMNGKGELRSVDGMSVKHMCNLQVAVYSPGWRDAM